MKLMHYLVKLPFSLQGSSNPFTVTLGNSSLFPSVNATFGLVTTECLELIIFPQMLSAQDEMGEVVTSQETGLK